MLELGIGTGRIALPVAAAGCRVVGIDLSAEMLDALRRQLPGHAGEPIDLVRGDIAVLPFRAATFDAAMATHILHLVPDWKSVLGRLAEVLGVGASPVHAGPGELVAAEWQAEVSPAQVLQGIRSRDDAESWVLPDEILEPVSAQLDEFAAREWAEPERPQVVLRRFLISVYRNGGAPPTPAVAPAAP
jgi:ubiquinone/menaquinone biosynthesis C-methylase UbiE